MKMSARQPTDTQSNTFIFDSTNCRLVFCILLQLLYSGAHFFF